MLASSPICATGIDENRVRPRTARRSACSGVPAAGRPSIPKIPAMITSSVIACIRGAIANGSPTGQPSISRSAASTIICVYCAIASP